MKYTKEERLAIGSRIYTKEINCAEAALEYDIDMYTARDYMRLYKAFLKMQERAGADAKAGSECGTGIDEKAGAEARADAKAGAGTGKEPLGGSDRYETMTREELIAELKRLKGE